MLSISEKDKTLAPYQERRYDNIYKQDWYNDAFLYGQFGELGEEQNGAWGIDEDDNEGYREVTLEWGTTGPWEKWWFDSMFGDCKAWPTDRILGGTKGLKMKEAYDKSWEDWEKLKNRPYRWS